MDTKSVFTLFELDCLRQNLMYKLNAIEQTIETIKDRILVRYPFMAETLIFEVNPYVVRISHNDVEVYTQDQYEKIEGLVDA